MSKIGVLFDNISGNTGDVAIGLSVRKILRENGIESDMLFPGNFDPDKYGTIIIGGGRIIRPGPDFFYDKFKVPGSHILNAVGIAGSPKDLGYLDDYKYVTVRSTGDKDKLGYVKNKVHVVPCTAMLLEDLKEFQVHPKGPSLGINLSPGSFNGLEEREFIRWASSLPLTIYFIPIMHYKWDYRYMQRLSASIPNSVALPILKPLEIFTLIGRMDRMITYSLHGGIFSYVHNKPFILCDQIDKMRFFMEDRGLQRYLFKDLQGMKGSFKSLYEEPPDYTRLISRDLQVLDRHVDRLVELLPAGDGEPLKDDGSDEAFQQYHYLHSMRMSMSVVGREGNNSGPKPLPSIRGRSVAIYQGVLRRVKDRVMGP